MFGRKKQPLVVPSKLQQSTARIIQSQVDRAQRQDYDSKRTQPVAPKYNIRTPQGDVLLTSQPIPQEEPETKWTMEDQTRVFEKYQKEKQLSQREVPKVAPLYDIDNPAPVKKESMAPVANMLQHFTNHSQRQNQQANNERLQQQERNFPTQNGNEMSMAALLSTMPNNGFQDPDTEVFKVRVQESISQPPDNSNRNGNAFNPEQGVWYHFVENSYFLKYQNNKCYFIETSSDTVGPCYLIAGANKNAVGIVDIEHLSMGRFVDVMRSCPTIALLLKVYKKSIAEPSPENEKEWDIRSAVPIF
jgi:hypothetical protein